MVWQQFWLDVLGCMGSCLWMILCDCFGWFMEWVVWVMGIFVFLFIFSFFCVFWIGWNMLMFDYLCFDDVVFGFIVFIFMLFLQVFYVVLLIFFVQNWQDDWDCVQIEQDWQCVECNFVDIEYLVCEIVVLWMLFEECNFQVVICDVLWQELKVFFVELGDDGEKFVMGSVL